MKELMKELIRNKSGKGTSQGAGRACRPRSWT